MTVPCETPTGVGEATVTKADPGDGAAVDLARYGCRGGSGHKGRRGIKASGIDRAILETGNCRGYGLGRSSPSRSRRIVAVPPGRFARRAGTTPRTNRVSMVQRRFPRPLKTGGPWVANRRQRAGKTEGCA